MFTALLDTCVLWPSLQRDFLLSLAAESVYRPIWSSRILDELIVCETDKRIERGADAQAARHASQQLANAMNDAFDDSCVYGWEALVGAYGLPDPNDEHVVAAAVIGGAGAIVTENVRDFPAHIVPAGIDVIRPRRFALDSVSVHPGVALAALEKISARYTNPAITVEGLLVTLETRYGMRDAVDLIRAQI